MLGGTLACMIALALIMALALALALAPDRDCRSRSDYNKIIFNSVFLCGSLWFSVK